MLRQRSIVVMISLAGLVLLLVSRVAAATNPTSWNAAELAHRGVYQMMDGQLAAAIQTQRQVEKEDPASPVGYLLEADATWWAIYYSTANLIDPDVFAVVSTDSTPYDERFRNLIDIAIEKSSRHIDQKQDVAESYLYEGMAYALRARLEGLRDHELATARAGKKMYSLLQTGLALDPNLTDAYAGIGLYNYFVATLPTIVKLLRWLIGLPGGSRAVGLRDLNIAAERGDYTRGEAQFYMAKDFTRASELRFAKSLQIFRQLSIEYPQNPFWRLMVASVEIRLGRRQAGRKLYQQIFSETSDAGDLVSSSVHDQVGRALARMSGQ